MFNNFFTNSVDELITQHQKIEMTIFSLPESFPREFSQIINIPLTERKVI